MPDFRTCLLKEENVEKIIEAIEKGTIERCLKTEKEELYKGYTNKEEFIEDRLYYMSGSANDIPNLEKLPQ